MTFTEARSSQHTIRVCMFEAITGALIWKYGQPRQECGLVGWMQSSLSSLSEGTGLRHKGFQSSRKYG